MRWLVECEALLAAFPPVMVVLGCAMRLATSEKQSETYVSSEEMIEIRLQMNNSLLLEAGIEKNYELRS